MEVPLAGLSFVERVVTVSCPDFVMMYPTGRTAIICEPEDNYT